MANYQKILLATDFSDLASPTMASAVTLAKNFNAQLCFLHVVEPLPITDPSFGAGIPMDFDLTSQLLDSSRERLAELGTEFSVPAEFQWVEYGIPAKEIVRIAEENSIDLIVVGTHGRSGLGVLLGSTASSVVHHAPCDVLTIRLKG